MLADGDVFLEDGGAHGAEGGFHEWVGAPPEGDVLAVLEIREDAAQFPADVCRVGECRGDAGVVEDDLASFDDALPCLRQGEFLPRAQDVVEFWRAEREEFSLRRLTVRIVLLVLALDVLILHDDVIRMDDRRHLAEVHGDRVAHDEIGDVDEVVRAVFEVAGVILRVYGVDVVAIIIGDVDEDDIRVHGHEALHRIVVPVLNGHVVWIVGRVTLPYGLAVVRIAVGKGQRDHERPAVLRIRCRRTPDGVEAIPHTRVYRQEYEQLFPLPLLFLVLRFVLR